MLVKESHVDLQTSSGLMRTYIYQPNLPGYPEAKFPGVAVFTGSAFLQFCPMFIHTSEKAVHHESNAKADIAFGHTFCL